MKSRIVISRAKHFLNLAKKKKSYLSVIFIVFLISFLFAYLSVYKLEKINYIDNVFLSYPLSLVDFLKKNPLWGLAIILVFFLTSFVSINSFNRLKIKKISLKVVLRSFSLALFLGILSIIIAFILTFAFGINNLGLLARKIRLNSGSAEIFWGKEMLLKRLNEMSSSPKIIETNYDSLNKEVLKIKIDQENTGSFYKSKIVPNIPRLFFSDLGVPRQSLVIVGDSLLVSEIKREDIEGVSGKLGSMFVSNYFKPRFIKTFPEVKVLGRQDYLKLRDEQINARLEKVDNVISLIDGAINDVYVAVANDKAKISANTNGLNESISARDSGYNYCISAGYYSFYTGQLIRFYTDDYCNSQKSSWDSTINVFQKNISDWTIQLSSDQSQLDSDLSLKSYVSNLRWIIASQKDQTPEELGIFEGDNNKIDIALDWINARSIYAYSETLTHEYLHYSSYISKDRTLPSFFEEGLTEYFARKIIKEEVGKDLNIGYPLYVKLISQMTNKISDSDFADIYFKKDQAGLVWQLDKAFGDKFYEKHETDFFMLPFLPIDESLKIANKIMVQIGGKEIDKIDVISNFN